MIDGGLFWGRNPSTGALLDEDALLVWLEESGLDAALVAPYAGIFFDYREANEKLAALAQRHSGKIIPAAIVQAAGFDTALGKKYFSELKTYGFRALGIYTSPSYYDISLESPLVQKIAHLAAEAGLVIQLGVRSASDVAQVAAHYANLPGPVLVRWMNGRGYQSYAEALNLGLEHPRFYFDIGSLTSSGLIRHFAERLGAERLYFTSNRPESFPWTSHLLLQSAGLDTGALQNIYGGTLSRIFNIPSKRPFCPEHWQAKFKPFFERPKIDTHWHSEGWNLIEPEKGASFFDPAIQQFNCQKIVISSIRALNGEMEKGNEDLFRYAEKKKEAYALIVVDPTRLEASLTEIKKYAAHPKVAGIKTIQDLYHLGLDSAAYIPLLERAAQEALSIMAHIPGMLAAATKYPQLTFICAHATYERVKSMFGQKNIYFDIATSHHDERETKLEDLIREAGDDRILFASDAPLMSPAWTLGKLAGLELTDAQWSRIFYDNACAAFPQLKAKVSA